MVHDEVAERAEQVKLVKQWLSTKQTTLWADWDLTHEDRLQLAAEWFFQQQAEFSKFWIKHKVLGLPFDVSSERFDVV